MTQERAAAMELRRRALTLRSCADELAAAAGRQAHFLNPQGRNRAQLREDTQHTADTVRDAVAAVLDAVEQLQDGAAVARGEVGGGEAGHVRAAAADCSDDGGGYVGPGGDE